MVLRQSDPKMASEQPVKKKLRRTTEDEQPPAADETDFIHTTVEPSESRLLGTADLSHLQLSLPSTMNEADITLNTLNTQLSNIPKSPLKHNNSGGGDLNLSWTNNIGGSASNSYGAVSALSNFNQTFITSYLACGSHSSVEQNKQITNHDRNQMTLSVSPPISTNHNRSTVVLDYNEHEHVSECEFDKFQRYLIKQCLCGVSEATLRKPFEVQQITDENGSSRTAMLIEWPTPSILEFLSKLQLLFDVYLKQNNKGYICARIVDVCDTIVRNEYNLIEQIIALCETNNKYINFLSAKVLSSFLIIAKKNINNDWLESIIAHLKTETVDYQKMNFALEVVKRVVEWKDIDIHVLEESQLNHELGAGSSSSSSNPTQDNITCTTIPFSDPDSYDTSAIKGVIIKSLEASWPELTNKIQYLITTHNGDGNVDAQACVITFLALWESTISIRANLSVIDTKPFYAHLEMFVGLLHGGSSLSAIIWKQLLSLFNEVLCYGSTLALQDMLPEDTCQLAHQVVRYVKDFRLLDSLPYRRSDGYTVNSFVGTIPSTTAHETTIDKTLLQKIVLLVLKSVAITIKETRSDSSDSSIGSDDYDFYQDMQLIERSIRDVLKKVDVFLKHSLDFHPETPFSKILVHLFSDQDDYMIESMVCTLDITIGISYRNALFPDLISMLNPIYSFVEFLKIVSHDSDVLLDYLVSNETCFLLYLLRFLKYTRRNWSQFVSSCSDSSASSRQNELDNTMTVLIRLKMQISRLVSKDLFPYNINPVLRLLELCEGLYEGNEYS